jgi:aromatic-L-amino-acid/L-tryptophan decarboxylase
MSRVLELASEMVIQHVLGLPEAASHDEDDAHGIVESLRGLVGREPSTIEDALNRFEQAYPKSYNTAAPGFLAYIPGGGLFMSAVADLLADSVNRYTGIWAAAPALCQIEADVVRWMLDIFGLPSSSRGILTTGGSMANFSALVTARVAKLDEDFSDGVIYATEQIHASVQKAARLGGFPSRAIRIVDCDEQLRMDPKALREAMVSDRSAGRRPFCIVASAGTTNTGAIDPLEELADVAEEEELWFHVDAAYGGFFQLTEYGRAAFRGISRADSITLDPHKGMFLPYGTGSLLVRDGERLLEAHTVGSDIRYMQDLPDDPDAINFAGYSPELTRDFRGLRVWLPLRVHGVEAFRATLEEKLELTTILADGIRGIDGLEVVYEPQLTVVPFAVKGTKDPDAATKVLLDEINASRRVFMSSTQVADRFVIRPCILSHRTHRDRIDEAIAIIGDAAAKILARFA